jgi:hypothetical protein
MFSFCSFSVLRFGFTAFELLLRFNRKTEQDAKLKNNTFCNNAYTKLHVAETISQRQACGEDVDKGSAPSV